MTRLFTTVKTNSLRRNPDSSYTLRLSSDKDALCKACALYNDCPTRQSKQIESCFDFMPVFAFTDGTNLDKAVFNTIRIGEAWSKRLEIGQTIAIYDKKADTLMMAKVVDIDWSIDKEIMLERHAAINHLGMNLSNPPSELSKILQNNYGKGFYSKSKGLTAIYLSPLV